MNGPRTYTLLGADGRHYQSASKGQWGGHRSTRIYGRLDCPAALRSIARGGYTRYRVFFPDQATAIAAGYRPCATCCPDRYQEWNAPGSNSSRPPGERPILRKACQRERTCPDLAMEEQGAPARRSSRQPGSVGQLKREIRQKGEP
jgi:Metal binding domain of Ada